MDVICDIQDVSDLEKMKDDIVKQDKLKFKMVVQVKRSNIEGYEQYVQDSEMRAYVVVQILYID